MRTLSRHLVFLTLILLLSPPGLAGESSLVNVRDHGAVGDGETSDTAAINRAVEACGAEGGGVVRFPPGRYLSGTIRLRSGITLEFQTGATLVGTTVLDEYEHFSPPEGTPEAGFRPQWHRALILGVGVDNVAIVGPGTVDGDKVFDPRGEERQRGPHTILLGNSRGIAIHNLTVRDSANYAVMLEGCSDVDLDGLTVTGGWDGVHFRGWPGDPCRKVTISNSRFFTGDDAIAGRYWEDTLITGCVINSSCNGIRLIGPATRLIIQDCLFYGPGRFPHRTSDRTNMLAGINLQPGGWDATEGPLDDVLIADVTMRNVASPLHLSLKPGNTAGRIAVERLSATGVYRAACSVESWAETPIEHVSLSDLRLEFQGGVPAAAAPARAVKAPGVDPRPLPSWGLYARNVGTLVLEDVRLRLIEGDSRPVLIADDVARLVLDRVRGPIDQDDDDAEDFQNVGEVIRREATACSGQERAPD